LIPPTEGGKWTQEENAVEAVEKTWQPLDKAVPR
jgi:hypothetical protein